MAKCTYCFGDPELPLQNMLVKKFSLLCHVYLTHLMRDNLYLTIYSAYPTMWDLMGAITVEKKSLFITTIQWIRNVTQLKITLTIFISGH